MMVLNARFSHIPYFMTEMPEQTVTTLIKRHRTRRLICVYTVCYSNIIIEVIKWTDSIFKKKYCLEYRCPDTLGKYDMFRRYIFA